MPVVLYVLSCPLSGDPKFVPPPRYVGKSKNLGGRIRAHISKARAGATDHHCARWIRSLLAVGLKPVVSVVDELPDDADWQAAERDLIRKMRAAGHDLTNMTGGGDGFHNVADEVLAKRGASLKRYIAANREKFLDAIHRGHSAPEALENYRVASTRAWADPETRERFIAGMNATDALQRRASASKKRFDDPVFAEGHRVRLSAIWNEPGRQEEQRQRSLAAWADPEIAARIIAGQLAAYKRPEVKAANLSALAEIRSRPETTRKKREKATANWADPIIGGKQRAAIEAASPKMKQSARANWDDPVKAAEILAKREATDWRANLAKAAQARSTPEYSASQAEGAKRGWEKRRARIAAEKEAEAKALVGEPVQELSQGDLFGDPV